MRKVGTVNQYSLNEITAESIALKETQKQQILNDVTNRTAGTSDTMHKTFDSANNSGNVFEKIPHSSSANPNQQLKPPRQSEQVVKPRPQTSGAAHFNFYRNHGPSSKDMGVLSLSESNDLKLNRQNTASHQLTPSAAEGVLDNYQIGKPIGQGAYATVYVCYHKSNMKKFAIKIYQKVKLNDSMKRKAV